MKIPTQRWSWILLALNVVLTVSILTVSVRAEVAHEFTSSDLDEAEEALRSAYWEEGISIGRLSSVLSHSSSTELKVRACKLLERHVAEEAIDELIESIKTEREVKLVTEDQPDVIVIEKPCQRALIEIGPAAMDDLLRFALKTEDEEARTLALEAYDLIQRSYARELRQAVDEIVASSANSRDEILQVIRKGEPEPRALEDLAEELRRASSVEEMDELIGQAHEERLIYLSGIEGLLKDSSSSKDLKVRACYILGSHHAVRSVRTMIQHMELETELKEIGKLPLWFRYPCKEAIVSIGKPATRHLVNFMAATDEDRLRNFAAETFRSIEPCCWEESLERNIRLYSGEEANRLRNVLEHLRAQSDRTPEPPAEPENDRDD